MAKRFDYDAEKLVRCWRDARVADAYGRDRRREIIRHYAGSHWAEQGLDVDQPLNLLSVYLGIVPRSLIAREPRFFLSTFDQSQVAACAAAEEWGNRELKRMKAAIALRRIVMDALCGVGIGRVALVRETESAARGWGPKGGEPCLTRIDREDFAYDPFAGDFSECAWLAHSYRVPLVAAREHPAFRKGRKDLQATKPAVYDEYGVERVGVLSRSFYGQTEAEDMVQLWEFYLPRQRAVLTFETSPAGVPIVSADNKPLGEQPWVGPENGPYHFLGYQWVPGNAMPKGPLMDLFDAHCAANILYRKAMGSAERTKTVGLYQNAEDAKRVRDADDGGTAYVDNPQAVENTTFGGEHVQATYGFAQAMRELFDFTGGNLAVLGGRAQQASTAHQEAQLNTNAQGAIADLAEATTRFTDDLVRALCWYWWKHPSKVMSSPFTVAGLGKTYTRKVYPKGAVDEQGQPRGLRREADFDDLDIEVDTYSLPPETAGHKLATLRDVWKNEVLPAMPLLQQAGIMPDYHKYFQKIGRYTNDPDFEELLTVCEPPPDPQGSTGGQGQPLKPGSTERTVTRSPSSEKTDSGQGRSQITQMLSGANQGGAPTPQPMGAMP